MFAVGLNCYTYIYNFYTLECPANHQCKGHSGKIECIDWFSDDSGFCDGCTQGMCAFYDLEYQRAEMLRCKDDDFKRHKAAITSCASIPGAGNRAIVASDERQIWDTIDHRTGYDTRCKVSQIAVSANTSSTYIFTGFGEEGHPGSVQVWKLPL